MFGVVHALVCALILVVVLVAFTGRDRAVLFGRSQSIEVNGIRRTFLVVGLKIKRELVEGELRKRRKALVPVVAAVGGMG